MPVLFYLTSACLYCRRTKTGVAQQLFDCVVQAAPEKISLFLPSSTSIKLASVRNKLSSYMLSLGLGVNQAMSHVLRLILPLGCPLKHTIQMLLPHALCVLRNSLGLLPCQRRRQVCARFLLCYGGSAELLVCIPSLHPPVPPQWNGSTHTTIYIETQQYLHMHHDTNTYIIHTTVHTKASKY